MSSINRIAIVLIAIFSVNTAFAINKDFKEPISVNSNKQIAEIAKNEITFLENVVITQGSLLIKADKVVIKQDEKGQLKSILAAGNPATFKQKMQNGRYINAHAKELTYKPITKTIQLKHNAVIQQEDSKLSGNIIRYNMSEERVEAESNKGNQNDRVVTVFIPEQLQSQIKSAKKENSNK